MDELGRRVDAFVYIGCESITNDEDEARLWLAGNRNTCLGLTKRAAMNIQRLMSNVDIERGMEDA